MADDPKDSNPTPSSDGLAERWRRFANRPDSAKSALEKLSDGLGNWSALEGKPIWSPAPGPGEPGYSQDLRRDVADAIEQSEAAMAKPVPSINAQAMADKAVFGICELLGLLFGLPFGEDLYHRQPIDGWHWFYLAIGLLFAGAGPMFPWIRTRTWIPQAISASLSRAALDARFWIAGLLLLFLYSATPEIYRRATVAPPSVSGFTQDQVDAKIASATAPLNEKIASLQHQIDDAKKTLPPSQPPSAQPLQPATYGSLYPWQIRILVDALTELKPEIPTPPNIAVARPQMVEPQIFSRQFENAILRAGVTPIVSQQNPGSRDQTGVMIGVPDINNPSGIALEMQKVIRQMGFDGGFVALPSTVFLPDKKSGEFAIFIAPPAL